MKEKSEEQKGTICKTVVRASMSALCRAGGRRGQGVALLYGGEHETDVEVFGLLWRRESRSRWVEYVHRTAVKMQRNDAKVRRREAIKFCDLNSSMPNLHILTQNVRLQVDGTTVTQSGDSN